MRNNFCAIYNLLNSFCHQPNIYFHWLRFWMTSCFWQVSYQNLNQLIPSYSNLNRQIFSIFAPSFSYHMNAMNEWIAEWLSYAIGRPDEWWSFPTGCCSLKNAKAPTVFLLHPQGSFTAVPLTDLIPNLSAADALPRSAPGLPRHDCATVGGASGGVIAADPVRKIRGLGSVLFLGMMSADHPVLGALACMDAAPPTLVRATSAASKPGPTARARREKAALHAPQITVTPTKHSIESES